MARFKLYIFTILLQVFFTLTIFSQNRRIDSLRIVLADSKTDSARYAAQYQIGLAYELIDYRISRKMFDSLVELAEQKKFTLMQANITNEIGGLGFDHGDYATAIKYFNKANVLYAQVNDSLIRLSGQSAIYNNIGGIVSLLNDWESAQKYYLKALEGYEKLKDTSRMITVIFNIGFLFSDMDEWNKSYEYLYRSVQMINSSRHKTQNLQACSRLATICFKTGRQKEGLYYLQKSDSLLKHTDADLAMIYYHHAYGEYYRYRKNYSEAILNHKPAYHYAIRWDDPYYVAEEANEVGRDYLLAGNYDSAELYFKNSLKVANQYNYKPKVLLTLSNLSDLEEAKGNINGAYAYKARQAKFADSLVKEQNHYRIFLMDEEFEAEKKSNEIIQLQKDKQIQALTIDQKSTLNYILIGSVVALLLVGFLAFRNVRHRHKLARQQDELQQQRIRELEKDRQLLTVNSMLKGQEDERTRLARDLHDGLGGLLSGVKFSLINMKDNLVMTPDNMAVFERSLDMIDTSIRELRRVAHNMMPEILTKFGLEEALKEYCSTINATKLLNVRFQSHGMDKRLDQSVEIIIYRIVQELLNNVIKHAGASEAFVQLIQEDNRLNIVVEDNGKGFDTASLESSTGAGWANIRSRVEYLKGQLDINSEQEKGTLVNIEFKI